MTGTANTENGEIPGGRLCLAVRERAAGLKRFGYRQDDAEFLLLAALVGGYFVRRQFRVYAGCQAGSRETRMLRLGTANGHVASVVGESLYRVGGASFRRGSGLDGILAGPGRAWRSVKKALIALDYCLEASPLSEWLLSEADKVRYFGSLGISPERFPIAARSRAGKPRPFPDFFPIRVAGGEHPVVSYSYAQAGATESGVLRHLSLYEPLAAALKLRNIGCEWVVLADSPGQFSLIRAAWRRWRDALFRDQAEREYFGLRQAVERRHWTDLSGDAIERYADLCVEHSGKGTERRYRQWLESDSPGPELGADFINSCRYSELLLDRDYSIADRVEP